MKIQARAFVLTALALATASTAASAQSVLFDFDNAPIHTSLPIDLTVGGITAHFSATGQGFSIQDMSAPVAPIGFSGRFIYPNSVFQADLLISYDHTLTEFSILYSPQELGCDDSATMRVSAYMNGNLVGTATHVAANPGTWPVDTLSCTFAQGFNSVVVHYDHKPPTCTDWGPIFCADDMRVTPMGNPIAPFCFGDGSIAACPCGNTGLGGRGCNNSIATGGALFTATGNASLSADTLGFASTGELPSALSILLQGNASIAPVVWGDGVRCTGGLLLRLFKHNAIGGTVAMPQAGDATVSARSAAGGDPIPAGGARWYQVYYRDPNLTFCAAGFNASNGLAVPWSQ